MNRRAALLLPALLLPAVLAGCAAAPQPAGPLVVTEAQNGGSVTLGPAQQLVIRLAANASTGYSWAATQSANLRLVSQDYAWQGGPPGSGGVQQYVFVPAGTGPARLAFVYRRPWETQEKPARSFALGVVIQPG